MLPAKPKLPHRIALVDCNNFYASCERVFRPAWNDRPLGVLSNNDGCIIARSNELKDAGVPMGAPYFQIKDHLEALNAVIVSSNYTLYGDMSARVMDTLSRFTPDMEIYSIDEAWLNLTGFNPATLDSYGRKIVATTFQHTGIPVSMGIAPTKVLAKIANRLCKKHKLSGNVFNLGDSDALEGILSYIKVSDVWGIGKRLAIRLNEQGIYSAWDLRCSDPHHMRDLYSVVMQRIVLELRGFPCLSFEDIQPKKQIIASRSFGQRVTDQETLMEAVSLHATRAGEKLRSQGSVCGSIQVSIRSGQHNPDGRYYSRSVMVRFSVATADTRKLIRAARRGVETIYLDGVRYAKAGVMLCDIVPVAETQAGLFDRGDNPASQRLMALIDQVNKHTGQKSLFFASEGIQKSWAMKRGRMTPAFTTQWKELPLVK